MPQTECVPNLVHCHAELSERRQETHLLLRHCYLTFIFRAFHGSRKGRSKYSDWRSRIKHFYRSLAICRVNQLFDTTWTGRISQTVYPRTTDFYTDIHTDIPSRFAGYDVTIAFRSEVVVTTASKLPSKTTSSRIFWLLSDQGKPTFAALTKTILRTKSAGCDVNNCFW